MARKDIPDWLVVSMAARLRESRKEWPRPNLIQLLAFATGEPTKVCYSAAYRTCHRGLICFGVSIRWGFPERSGEDLIGWCVIPDVPTLYRVQASLSASPFRASW